MTACIACSALTALLLAASPAHGGDPSTDSIVPILPDDCVTYRDGNAAGAIRRMEDHEYEISYSLNDGDWIDFKRSVMRSRDYQGAGIRLELRAEGGVNSFEVKVEDTDGSVFGWRLEATRDTALRRYTIRPEDFSYWWGGDLWLDEVKSLHVAVVRREGGNGRVIIRDPQLVRFPSRAAPASERAAHVEEIISDMTLDHEGRPHGVPEWYGWSVRPRVQLDSLPRNLDVFTAWGQVYEAAEGNPAVNTRVQLKDMRSYILSRRQRKWVHVQGSRGVAGSAYPEPFNGPPVDARADVRRETDGSVSVRVGGGYNYHFWPTSPYHLPVDRADIAGVYTTVMARLILDDDSGPDDRAQARLVLNIGADLKRYERGKPETANDVGMGRFKYVTREWRVFNMITLPPDEARRNPPPD